jgi:uncharacterized membrane-anchored protein YitT (DUF2179 family)
MPAVFDRSEIEMENKIKENMTEKNTEKNISVIMDTDSKDADDKEELSPEKGTVRKLKGGAGSRRHRKDSRKAGAADVLDSLDRNLAKQEAANREANRVAAVDPELHGKSRMQVRAAGIATALLAALVGSFGTVCVLLPNGLTFGGITGIARLINVTTGCNYSLAYYALSLAIALIVLVFLGFKELRKIILMSISYPTIMLLLQLSGIEYHTDDKILAAVLTGVIYGISNGLTFKAGYSSGGTDSLAKVIKYKRLPHMSINDLTFAINTLIVIANAVVLGIDVALYAVMTIYVSMRLGEAVMYGLSTKLVELDIIPGDADALTKYIMDELGRGVSSVEITGEYTGEKRKQLKIICSPRESFLIKRHLAKNDPKSFVAVYSVNSVWGVGRGFSDIRSME